MLNTCIHLLHCLFWPEKCYMNANIYCCFVALQGSNVVEDQDLLEIGILNSAHRQRLLQAIRLLPRVSTAANQAIKLQRSRHSESLSFVICGVLDSCILHTFLVNLSLAAAANFICVV